MARRRSTPKRSIPRVPKTSVSRASMPEIEQYTERTSPRDDVMFGGGRQSQGRPYDDVMFGGRPSTPGYDPPRRQYRRLYPHLSPGRDQVIFPTKGDQLRREIKRWRSTGDDGNIVPHSTYPGQTSNPARPRTQAMGYDEESRELRIKFREGAIYVYYDVPPDVYEELLAADSIGQYMNHHLEHSYMYDQESYNRGTWKSPR